MADIWAFTMANKYLNRSNKERNKLSVSQSIKYYIDIQLIDNFLYTDELEIKPTYYEKMFSFPVELVNIFCV